MGTSQKRNLKTNKLKSWAALLIIREIRIKNHNEVPFNTEHTKI